MSTLVFKDAKNYPLTAEVMVIDDQLTSRIIMESIVKSIGDNIRVSTYDNAVSALRVAEESPPDLIIVDYKMPEMNGVTFTRKIRAMPKCMDVPIIIFTIVDDKSVMYESLEAGATDFLTKPIDHYECKVRCRNLLTMRRQQIIIRERASTLETLILNATHSVHAREKETLALITRITDVKGNYTGFHPARIGAISKIIAREVRLDNNICDLIEITAPLHDIGEMRIPDEILMKFGVLDDDEIETMKQHTSLGHDLLVRNSSPVLKFAASIALNHHEHFDGTGYPNGLSGDNIPIEARIVAVADAFDAMTSYRSYKPLRTIDEAIKELIDKRDTIYDPACVGALIENMDSISSIHNHKINSK
jgi:two-component system, response regulator RpfG